MQFSRDSILKMIQEQIARTRLRASDTFKPTGALAGEIILDPLGGLLTSKRGVSLGNLDSILANRAGDHILDRNGNTMRSGA